jgi:hypothetical protein
MNPMERLLQGELFGLTDRIASQVGGRTVSGMAALRPEAHQRSEAASQRLSELREELLDRYAEWRTVVDTCEALWMLAEDVTADSATPDAATADEWAVTLDRRAA